MPYRPLRVSVPVICRMAFWGGVLCAFAPVGRFFARIADYADVRAESAVNAWEESDPQGA